MKAMILAAGRGERLRPLTDVLPKPLLRMGEHSLIEHQILSLHDAGVTEIAINLCYQFDVIQEALGNGDRYNVKIHYFVEKNPPLDTGGGVINAMSMLGDTPFILTSADIYTSFPYQTLRDHMDKKAYLVLVENPEYNQQGDFHLSDDGQISLQKPRLTYANIALLQPSIFDEFNLKRLPLRDVLYNAIEKEIVYGECYWGNWHNVGTVDQYKKCQLTLKPYSTTD